MFRRYGRLREIQEIKCYEPSFRPSGRKRLYTLVLPKILLIRWSSAVLGVSPMSDCWTPQGLGILLLVRALESAFQGTGIVGRLRVESCDRDRQPQNFGPNPDYYYIVKLIQPWFCKYPLTVAIFDPNFFRCQVLFVCHCYSFPDVFGEFLLIMVFAISRSPKTLASTGLLRILKPFFSKSFLNPVSPVSRAYHTPLGAKWDIKFPRVKYTS